MIWMKITGGVLAGVLWFLAVAMFAFAVMSSLRF
jgi:hypothetical protein